MTKKMKIIRAKQIKLLHREKIERKTFHYTGRSFTSSIKGRLRKF